MANGYYAQLQAGQGTNLTDIAQIFMAARQAKQQREMQKAQADYLQAKQQAELEAMQTEKERQNLIPEAVAAYNAGRPQMLSEIAPSHFQEMEANRLANERIGLERDRIKIDRDRLAQPESAQLDAIGKRVILENGFRPGTPEFQKRYGELAQAQNDAEMNEKKTTRATDAAANLRKEFQGLPAVKDFQAIGTAYEKVKSSTPTGAGDISLIFGFMKMIDPSSTVREGEFATAENSGGIPTKIIGMYNKVLNGQRLPPEMRAQFRTEAESLLNAQQRRFTPVAAEYRRLATKLGVSPDDVVLGFAPQQLAQQQREQRPNMQARPAGIENLSDAELERIAGGQ